jgi:Bromodomain
MSRSSAAAGISASDTIAGPSIAGHGPLDEFYTLLSKLLQAFYAKDPYGFFYEAVDVNIVTDYLNIIKQPMDFSLMSKKIQQREYGTLREFQSDFELICSNCMIYNAPNTVYYKTAQKLLHYGRKLISKEAQKANALLILAATEEASSGSSSQAGGTTENASDFATGTLAQLKRKAEVALFKKLHDGTMLFTSLKKYRGGVTFPIYDDGSLNLSEYAELEAMLIQPLTTDMLTKGGDEVQRTNLSKLGATGNILGSFVTRGQQPRLPQTSLIPHSPSALGYPYNLYSLNLYSIKPFYSCSPFYESQGYAINPFDSGGLSLVYGDPKGRAYIESLERFLQRVDGRIEGGYPEMAVHRKDLLDDLSCDGHAYVQTVYAWRRRIKEQQQQQKPKEAIEESRALSKETEQQPGESSIAAAGSGGEEGELLLQVKSDLTILARLLRWKKVAPEMDRLAKQPAQPYIRHFYQQMQSQLPTEPVRAPPESNLSVSVPPSEKHSLTDKLVQISKMLLQLQAYQNERFKEGTPAAISSPERSLVSALRTVMVEVAAQLSPHDLLALPHSVESSSTATSAPVSASASAKFLPIHAAMQSLTEGRSLPLFQGTLDTKPQ